MSLLHSLRLTALHFGLDVNRYTPINSDGSRLNALLEKQRIDLVLDIGANDGGFARLLREHRYNGRILSFEPLSDAYKKLLNNSCKDYNWKIYQQSALGEFNGEIEINIAANSTSSSVLPMLHSHIESAPTSIYIGKEIVEIARLDSIKNPWIDQSQRIYLKIDTQGYEKSVLVGAKNTLNKINGIQIEMSLTPLYNDTPLFRELFDYLENIGYEIYDLIPGFRDIKTGRLLQLDGIFIKKHSII